MLSNININTSITNKNLEKSFINILLYVINIIENFIISWYKNGIYL